MSAAVPRCRAWRLACHMHRLLAMQVRLVPMPTHLPHPRRVGLRCRCNAGEGMCCGLVHGWGNHASCNAWQLRLVRRAVVCCYLPPAQEGVAVPGPCGPASGQTRLPPSSRSVAVLCQATSAPSQPTPPSQPAATGWCCRHACSPCPSPSHSSAPNPRQSAHHASKSAAACTSWGACNPLCRCIAEAELQLQLLLLPRMAEPGM